MPVVTIGREFGAGGEPVGRLVAERLGSPFADHSLMDVVASRLGLPGADVDVLDERPGSLLERLLAALGSAHMDLSAAHEVAAWVPPHADPTIDARKAVLDVTQQVILELARTGDAVIVGRAAAFVVRGVPHATHVFLRAPQKVRVRWARETLGLDEEAARRKVKETDANRAAYVRQIYGHDWSHPGHYDLVLDTHRLGVEGAADLVLAAVRVRSVSYQDG